MDYPRIFIVTYYENDEVPQRFHSFARAMPRPRSYLASSASPVAVVRVALALSQQQLADWLGVTVGFVGALDTGRNPLPAALAPRLLVLAHLLPPPDGPALPPLPAAPAPVPLAYTPPAAPATSDPLGPPAAGPLRTAARTARLAALAAERALLRAHAQAVALARRRRGLALLHAAPPPTEAAEAARWALWLATLAADLAAADPQPAQAAARRHLLAVRAAARHAEADALLAGVG